MENEKKNKIGEFILLLGFAVIFVVVNFPGVLECLAYNKLSSKTLINIRVFSIIIYCSVSIPTMFSVFKIKDIKKCYYYVLPFMYILLPIILILNTTNNLKTPFIALTILIASLIMAFYIYKILKQIKELNIKYLRFSSFIISTIMAIICAYLDLFCIINIKFLVFSASLLFLLEIVYKEIDLERNGNANGDQHPNIDQNLAQLKSLTNDSLTNTQEQEKLLEDLKKNLNASAEIINKMSN